jgi:hypothetical protein
MRQNLSLFGTVPLQSILTFNTKIQEASDIYQRFLLGLLEISIFFFSKGDSEDAPQCLDQS